MMNYAHVLKVAVPPVGCPGAARAVWLSDGFELLAEQPLRVDSTSAAQVKAVTRNS